MAVKIGHSSIDENGNIKSGSAGDQNGKEVCVREWYNKGWNVVLRPTTTALAEKSALACEQGCANVNIGYDQNQRNTLYTQAKAAGYVLSQIKAKCECDCSSFMHVCAIAGGANLSYGSNGLTTRTMVAAFSASGDYVKLTDKIYLTTDKYLKRGDILVREGSHTVMVLENGEDADKMEIIRGIDTSKWQASKVDYAAAKAAGYLFAILRVGCGSTKDKCFEADYAAARAAGMKVGVYFYTYSKTEAQAIADATRVLGWLNDRHLDLPVAFDVEDAKQKGTARQTANSKMYNAFAAKIRDAGYDTMLYTGEWFINNYFDKSLLNDKLWIAKYSVNKPSIGMGYDMWQYTSDAYAHDFYTKKLDRNYWFTNDRSATIVIGNPYPIPTRNLKRKYPMMKGNDVKWLQWELNQEGFALDVDGKFGDVTKSAVKTYQKMHGLKVDGIVGTATRYALTHN